MDDKIEEIIKTIALHHSIAIGRDDPILVLHTLNERLMQENRIAQKEILHEFKSELQAIARSWSESAKGRAEMTINSALTTSKETMANGMKEGARDVTEIVKRELDEGLARLSLLIQEAKRIAIMNMVAAGLAVFAAVIALWAIV